MLEEQESLIDVKVEITINDNLLIYHSSDIKLYRQFRQELKRQGVELPLFSKKQQGTIKVNLPTLQPWQQYALAMKLKLVNGDQSLGIEILKQAYESTELKPTFNQWNPQISEPDSAYILLGGSLNRGINKEERTQLKKKRQHFWRAALESFEISKETYFETSLETVKKQYLVSTAKKNDPNQDQQLINFLKDISKQPTLLDKLFKILAFLNNTSSATIDIQKAIKANLKGIVFAIIDDAITAYPLTTPILICIKKHYKAQKNFSTREAENCAKLINLIENNQNPEQLPQKILEFFNDPTQFRNRLLRRDALRDRILNFFDKPIIVDSRDIAKAYEPLVIALLKTLKPGDKIKKGKEYAVAGFKLKFTHSIEINEEQKIHVMSGKGNGQIGSGTYGSVKSVMQQYRLTENNQLEKNNSPWVVKSIKRGTKEDVENEIAAIKECAADLIPSGMFVRNKTMKFFMQNAGDKNLRSFIKEKKALSSEILHNILIDLLKQAYNANKKGWFIFDIKPDNVAYNGKKATIVDHGLTMSVEKYRNTHPWATPLYLPPEMLDTYQNTTLLEKVMVFSIGVLMAEVLVGNEILADRNSLHMSYKQPLKIELLDKYMEQHPETRALISLIKQMIELKYENRIDIQNALEAAENMPLIAPEKMAFQNNH